MARLFVAVWPDDVVIAALDRVEVTDGVRPVPRANWHTTLRFLGDAEPGAVAARLSAVSLPAAELTLGPTIRRLGRQLVVPVAGADELAAIAREATSGIGDDRPFVGHLTIARGEPGAPFVASMRATEVALVASSLQPTGAVYTTLATFPTTEPA